MAGISSIAGVGASASVSLSRALAAQAVSKDGEAVRASASPAAALKLLRTALLASPLQEGRFNALA